MDDKRDIFIEQHSLKIMYFDTFLTLSHFADDLF